MSIDYDTARYTFRQAAIAAGFEPNTLRSYYAPNRAFFRIIGGEAAKAKGLAGLLSLRDVLHLAVAQRLIEMGVHPRHAFEAGLDFAHTSDSPAGGPSRDPGELFDVSYAWTALVWQPGTRGRVVAMLAKDPTLSWADLFYNRHTGKRGPAVVILLNDVEKQVFDALGIGGE